jgi:hypothetical protein
MPNPRFFEHTNSTSSCNMRSLGQGKRDSSNASAGNWPISRVPHQRRSVDGLCRFELRHRGGSIRPQRDPLSAPPRRVLNGQFAGMAAGRDFSPTIDRLANQNVNRNSAVLRLSARGIIVRRWIRLGHSRWCQHSIGGPAAFLL